MAYSGRLVTSEGRVVARSQAPSCGISPTPCMKTGKPKGSRGPWGPRRELGASASQGMWGVSFPPSQPPPTLPGQMLGWGDEQKARAMTRRASSAPPPPPKRGGPSPGPGSSLAWCPPPPPSPRALLCPPEHSSAPLPRDLQVNLRVSAPLSTGQRQLPGQGPLASFVQDPAGRPRPVVVASLGPSYKLSVDHDGRQRPACLCPPNPFVFG